MIKRFLPLLAASALFAACETASTTSGDATSSAATSSQTQAQASASSETGSAGLTAENQLASVGDTVLFGFDSASLTDLSLIHI